MVDFEKIFQKSIVDSRLEVSLVDSRTICWSTPLGTRLNLLAARMLACRQGAAVGCVLLAACNSIGSDSGCLRLDAIVCLESLLL